MDADQAETERRARQRLLRGGADALDRRPWQAATQPPSALDLVLHLLWRAGGSGRGAPVEPDDLVAALRLLPAVRADLDQVETGLLFAARSAGLTWGEVAAALGLRSPQAGQQRLDRLLQRGGPDGPDRS
jgi:hypothetical protein